MKNAMRGASVAAIGGALLLLIGTFVHPSGADPNDALAAFTEYAEDQLWIASHLTQLIGVALIIGTLIYLSLSLAGGSVRAWRRSVLLVQSSVWRLRPHYRPLMELH